ncbi:unnamed protein product [Chilo suppressalis]|uniref:KIX domain-containing protein n=1 Tax=Chilo suppressalis TaxID=168631 RepID=A0ABN8B790_CHISP|nr:hypothetical protein evm_011303 [Chilo suppressalis]CAH0401673.1 unnamed protein product [Chilo suppressalis]
MTAVVLKEWHNTVTDGLRDHLVNKLLRSITAKSSDAVFNVDDVPVPIVNKLMEIENAYYLAADSRSQYYHMLAVTIYKIQEYLSQKREQQQTLDTTGVTSAMEKILNENGELQEDVADLGEKLSQLLSLK